MPSDYQALPSVDRLLRSEKLSEAIQELGISLVTMAVRTELSEARSALSGGGKAASLDELADSIINRAFATIRPGLRPVINATGVILHTNLGRAPLSAASIEAMAAVTSGYSNLEYDLDAGTRGSRHSHVERAVCLLTGAEAAIVVNNNAAALLLTFSAIAAGGEVPVARSQVVEIGGGFRIPDVMRQSGAGLIDIGTTNRTYLRDYEEAITPQTRALTRIHASNFRVTGFTETPSIEALVDLAHRHGLPFIDDLGSGCLLATEQFGLTHEPMPQESISAGADLVLFSGDKLLGGPQAGIIAGRREPIERLRRHPLARAVRTDKTSIAALEATLGHYLKGEALREVPVWRMISATLAEMESRAFSWAENLGAIARVEDGRSAVGGGSLPGDTLPTRLIQLQLQGGREAELAASLLRQEDPPIIARIHDDAVLLDPRTVAAADDPRVKQGLLRVLRTTGVAQ